MGALEVFLSVYVYLCLCKYMKDYEVGSKRRMCVSEVQIHDHCQFLKVSGLSIIFYKLKGIRNNVRSYKVRQFVLLNCCGL